MPFQACEKQCVEPSDLHCPWWTTATNRPPYHSFYISISSRKCRRSCTWGGTPASGKAARHRPHLLSNIVITYINSLQQKCFENTQHSKNIRKIQAAVVWSHVKCLMPLEPVTCLCSAAGPILGHGTTQSHANAAPKSAKAASCSGHCIVAEQIWHLLTPLSTEMPYRKTIHQEFSSLAVMIIMLRHAASCCFHGATTYTRPIISSAQKNDHIHKCHRSGS